MRFLSADPLAATHISTVAQADGGRLAEDARAEQEAAAEEEEREVIRAGQRR